MLDLIHGWPLVGSVWTRNDHDFHGYGKNPTAPGETVTVGRVVLYKRTNCVEVHWTRDKTTSKAWHNLEYFLAHYDCSRAELPWIGEGI